MASLEQRPQGLTGWAASVVTTGRSLRHGPVILAPLRHRDRAAWERVPARMRVGCDRGRRPAAWLQIGPSTYAGLVRSVTRQARRGRCCRGWCSTTMYRTAPSRDWRAS